MIKKAEPPKRHPLLRSKLSIIDKIIENEGQQLAQQRLVAMERAHKMAVQKS